jgi:hypothetical protein
MHACLGVARIVTPAMPQEIWKGSASADEPSKADDFDDYFQSEAGTMATTPFFSPAALRRVRCL